METKRKHVKKRSAMLFSNKLPLYPLAESPSNTSDSPPSVSPLSSSIVLQREGIVNQPLSTPASPLSSLSSPVTQLNLPSPGDCTQDPNWQATKPTVRERNAAMFNNHLMADIIFIVGSPGTISHFLNLNNCFTLLITSVIESRPYV